MELDLKRVATFVVVAGLMMKGCSILVERREADAVAQNKARFKQFVARTNPLPPGASPVEQAGSADDAAFSSVTESGRVGVRPSTEAAPARDEESIRTMVAGASGTYLQNILAQQSQMILRWPERRFEPLRVWIQRSSDVENWEPSFPIVAEKAFDEWREAGFPLAFDIVTDSASANIRIRWVSQIQNSPSGRGIGRTDKMRDQYGWILTADIIVATHNSRGRPLTAETIAGVARHEVGHALGLGHSSSPDDVMYPESRTPVISEADRKTLHVLYMLPPGVVK